MRTMHLTASTTIAIAASALVLGCSRHESAANSAGATTGASASASAPSTASAPTGGASSDSIVRGTVKEASDSVLALTTPAGDVRVTITQPLKVYTRRPADLSRVTDNVFVGVTSVPQPDGSQRATEIHIFPEELRGLGEGSRPMSAPASGSRSTMTNGSVVASRMTNGTSRGAAGGTITVQYNGGSQTITVPQGVTVTEIVPTTTKFAPGASVIALATKRPDGTLQASRVMIAGGEQRPK